MPKPLFSACKNTDETTDQRTTTAACCLCERTRRRCSHCGTNELQRLGPRPKTLRIWGFLLNMRKRTFGSQFSCAIRARILLPLLSITSTFECSSLGRVWTILISILRIAKQTEGTWRCELTGPSEEPREPFPSAQQWQVSESSWEHHEQQISEQINANPETVVCENNWKQPVPVPLRYELWETVCTGSKPLATMDLETTAFASSRRPVWEQACFVTAGFCSFSLQRWPEEPQRVYFAQISEESLSRNRSGNLAPVRNLNTKLHTNNFVDWDKSEVSVCWHFKTQQPSRKPGVTCSSALVLFFPRLVTMENNAAQTGGADSRAATDPINLTLNQYLNMEALMQFLKIRIHLSILARDINKLEEI